MDFCRVGLNVLDQPAPSEDQCDENVVKDPIAKDNKDYLTIIYMDRVGGILSPFRLR